jgi:Ca2+-binding EF-hand superfamily protein
MQASAFDAIDADKDGRISLEEWRTFFQHHGAMGAMPPSGQSMGGQGGGSLIRPPAKAGSGAN